MHASCMCVDGRNKYSVHACIYTGNPPGAGLVRQPPVSPVSSAHCSVASILQVLFPHDVQRGLSRVVFAADRAIDRCSSSTPLPGRRGYISASPSRSRHQGSEAVKVRTGRARRLDMVSDFELAPRNPSTGRTLAALYILQPPCVD
jgi:hypothetical protein